MAAPLGPTPGGPLVCCSPTTSMRPRQPSSRPAAGSSRDPTTFLVAADSTSPTRAGTSSGSGPSTDAAMRFVELATASERLAATSKRSEKSAILAEPVAGDVARRGGRGRRHAHRLATAGPDRGRVVDARASSTPARPTNRRSTILDVDHRLERARGSVGTRLDGDPSGDAPVDVRRRPRRPSSGCSGGVFGGELRQGALDGVMVDAIAKGSGVPIDEVRRAAHAVGRPRRDRPAGVCGRRGRAARRRPCSRGRAVEPMLASPAADVAEALAAHRRASVEWKLDGARVQAHRTGGDVRLYTRNLNDITDRLPGVVELVGRPARRRPRARRRGGSASTTTAAPRRFQDTMGDFGARGRDAAAASVLHAVLLRRAARDGERLIDEPLSRAPVGAGGARPGRVRGSRRSSPPTPTRRRAFMDEAVRRRPRGRDGEGARRRPTRPVAAAGRGARSSRCTRSTSSCSPPSGDTAPPGLAVEPPPRRAWRRRRAS